VIVRAIVIRRCLACGATGGLILSPLARLRRPVRGAIGWWILSPVASVRRPVRGAMVGWILSPMPIRITLTRARELAPSRKRALE
jgi:hypothetical protein